MRKVVQEYIQAKSNLLSYFKVEGEFYIKTATNYKWRISADDDWSIVSFWDNKDILTELAIVRKGGKPLIYKTRDYTMVVAIECVKVGFVFRNSNYINK